MYTANVVEFHSEVSVYKPYNATCQSDMAATKPKTMMRNNAKL